jgi:hypothetical protein
MGAERDDHARGSSFIALSRCCIRHETEGQVRMQIRMVSTMIALALVQKLLYC